MLNIHLNQIKNNLFFYEREKDDYEQNERAYITKRYDFLFLNELEITETLNASKIFCNYYDLMIDYKTLNLAECGENFLNTLEYTSLKDKYVIASYLKSDLLDFSSFLYSIANPRYFLSTLLETYRKLLENLVNLSNLGIVFYNISAANIYYTFDGIPLLKNIEKCIVLKNLNETYFSQLLKSNDNFVSNPIEIHVLFFLLNNDIDKLNADLIKMIVNHFVSSVKIFTFFSSDYRDNYVKDATEFFSTFIDKPKKYTIECILSYAKTWDSYSISFLFTYIVANVFKIFSLKGTFMGQFLSFLIKCLHPNPLKRETTENILYKYNELLYKNIDWSFVSKMDKKKLADLYTLLQSE